MAASDSATNHDSPSYFYRVAARERTAVNPPVPGERRLVIDTDKPIPELPNDVNDFISSFPELGHGDVVSFSDYRAADTFIVQQEGTDSGFSWIRNPDDTGTGHLTIPSEINSSVSDAAAKYHEIIQHHNVNLHLSGHDALLKSKLGNDIPQSWQFDLHFSGGQVQEAYVAFPNKSWRDVSWESVTAEELMGEFEASAKERSKFNVCVNIEGDDVAAYIAKHQPSGEKVGRLAWLAVNPKLPQGWKVEKGRGNYGPTHYHWIWKCEGPADQEAEARNRIEVFLRGFRHRFQSGSDSSLDW